ncbi:hypothetical protein ACWNXI_17470 [Caldibacillus thermoamylovorans]
MSIAGWEHCLQYCDHRRLAVVEENKRGIRFVNHQQKRVALYRVDDCLLKEGKRCDFLFLVEESQAFFVELKGADLEEAMRQIARTVEQLGKKLFGYRFEGRIIATRVRTPAIKSTFRIKLEKMLRKTGGSLVVKVNEDEVEV